MGQGIRARGLGIIRVPQGSRTARPVAGIDRVSFGVVRCVRVRVPSGEIGMQVDLGSVRLLVAFSGVWGVRHGL